jgi:hypothetical protein
MLPVGQTTLEPSTPILLPAVTKYGISQSLGAQFYREMMARYIDSTAQQSQC